MSLPMAAGPVIPNFGQGDKCVIDNRQFCWHWFIHNFGSRYEPRLVEHLELTAIAVGIGAVIAFTAAIVAYRYHWIETPFSLFAALLSTISLTTVAAYIGVGGLGQPIFNAIQTGFKTQFVAAGVLAILLALVVDLLLVAVQRVLTPWTRRLRTT